MMALSTQSQAQNHAMTAGQTHTQTSTCSLTQKWNCLHTLPSQYDILPNIKNMHMRKPCRYTYRKRLFQKRRGPQLKQLRSGKLQVLQQAQICTNFFIQLFPSCAYFNDIQSCSQIINLCTYSTATTPDSEEPECRFISSNTALKGYHYLDSNVDAFYMAPNSFKKSQ